MPLIKATGSALTAFKGTSFNTIMHGTDIYGNMTNSISVPLKTDYPVLTSVDALTEVGDKGKLGLIFVTEVSPKKFVVTTYTQYNQIMYTPATPGWPGWATYPGTFAGTGPSHYYESNYFHYTAFKVALANLKRFAEKFCDTFLIKECIPPLGSNMANYEATKVEDIINEVYDDRDITMFSTI